MTKIYIWVDIADLGRMVVESNKLSDKIEIIKNKMEDVELPEKVDVIVSEVPHFLFTILYF